jgi:hypothetical protein
MSDGFNGQLPDGFELPPPVVQITFDQDICKWMFMAVKPRLFSGSNAPEDVKELYRQENGYLPDNDTPLLAGEACGKAYDSLEECAKVLSELWGWFTGFSELPEELKSN